MSRRKKSATGIFLSLILGIIIGLVGFYLWKNYQPKEEIPLIQNKAEEVKNGQLPKEPPEGKTEEEILRPEISRQKVMDSVTEDISNLSPVEPVLGGKWRPVNFWFSDGYNFYVDYEDGHILRRLLISVEGKTENPKYKVIGYFESGENQMVLKEGEDILSDKDYEDLDLYGWDKTKKEWTKLN